MLTTRFLVDKIKFNKPHRHIGHIAVCATQRGRTFIEMQWTLQFRPRRGRTHIVYYNDRSESPSFLALIVVESFAGAIAKANLQRKAGKPVI